MEHEMTTTIGGNSSTDDGRNNVSALGDSSTAETIVSVFVYDERGALWYVITVMLVYSLSMFFLIATVVKRGSRNEITDRNVSRYLKGIELARQQARRETVLRIRLRWPGNFISTRHGARGVPAIRRADPGTAARTLIPEVRLVPGVHAHGSGEPSPAPDPEGSLAEDEGATAGDRTTAEDAGYLILNDDDGDDDDDEAPPRKHSHELASLYRPTSTRGRRDGTVDRPRLLMIGGGVGVDESDQGWPLAYADLAAVSPYLPCSLELNESPELFFSHSQSTSTASSSCVTSSYSQLSDDICLSDIIGTENICDTDNEV